MHIDIKQFINTIDGKLLTPDINIESIEVTDGYVSDLLSDVMGNAKEHQIWITIMKHLNTVAVASLTNIPCIVFANGVNPDGEVVKKAVEENVCLITSKLSSFNIAGELYKMLKGNIGE